MQNFRRKHLKEEILKQRLNSERINNYNLKDQLMHAQRERNRKEQELKEKLEQERLTEEKKSPSILLTNPPPYPYQIPPPFISNPNFQNPQKSDQDKIISLLLSELNKPKNSIDNDIILQRITKLELENKHLAKQQKQLHHSQSYIAPPLNPPTCTF